MAWLAQAMQPQIEGGPYGPPFCVGSCEALSGEGASDT